MCEVLKFCPPELRLSLAVSYCLKVLVIMSAMILRSLENIRVEKKSPQWLILTPHGQKVLLEHSCLNLLLYQNLKTPISVVWEILSSYFCIHDRNLQGDEELTILGMQCKRNDWIFFPNSRAHLPTFHTSCPNGSHFAQMGSHFAQNTTPNPCSLLSSHTPLLEICTYTKHHQPTQKHPFSCPELESGQNELQSGQPGPQLGKTFEKWTKLF